MPQVVPDMHRAVLDEEETLHTFGGALAEIKAFDPDEPRDEGGKWTDGGGGDSDSGSAAGESKPIPPEDKPSHGIHGLPSSVKVNDHLLQQAIDRGAYTISATEKPPGKYESGPPRYSLTVTARIPSGIKSFEQRPGRPSSAYYNPKLADLQTFNPGEKYLERTQATPKAGLSTKIAPLPGDNIIYRGMRAEEYQKFLDTGKIVSTGTYNMEGQEGLTYWATDPATAASYANGFAPWPHKATFEKPAYVVATTMPKETRHVPGTGENEVGVERPVDQSEIVGVWRGDVYEHLPGEADLVPTPEGHYQLGGGSGASSSVVWQAEKLQPATAAKPNWEDTASGKMTAGEKEIKDSGDEVTPTYTADNKSGNDPQTRFLLSLPLYDRHLSANTVWPFITTPKGVAALTLKEMYGVDNPSVEIYQLSAVDRGSGRAAMEMMTGAADQHGVTLELNPVPLSAQGEGKRLSTTKLEKFYAGFGFKQIGKRDAEGYIRMRRDPAYQGRALDPKRRIAWAFARARSAVLLDRKIEKYSDDEPRDEGGRWTDGGGSSGSDGDKPSSGGGTHAEQIAGIVRSLGYDPAKVSIGGDEKTVLNGKEYDVAATFQNFSGGKITVNSKDRDAKYLTGILAHEIGHAKFEYVETQFSNQRVAMFEEQNPTLSHQDALVKLVTEDPLPKVTSPEKYPVYAKLEPFLRDVAGMKRGAEISDYAKLHWAKYAATGKPYGFQYMVAINETLAEISRLDATGYMPGDSGKNLPKPWNDLYKAVQSIYAKADKK